MDRAFIRLDHPSALVRDRPDERCRAERDDRSDGPDQEVLTDTWRHERRGCEFGDDIVAPGSFDTGWSKTMTSGPDMTPTSGFAVTVGTSPWTGVSCMTER